MKRRRNAASLVALLLTASVLLASLVTVGYAQEQQQKKDVATAEHNVLARPYIEDNVLLARQITALKARIEKIERVGTRMSVTIFTHCSDNLYQRCYPVAERFDTASVFVIGDQQMVGREGCITLSQYDELILKGWVAALKIPLQRQEAESYLSGIEGEFAALQRPMPDAVYLEEGQFSEETVTFLKEKGFKTFLHPYEKEYFEGFDPQMSTVDDPVYIPYLYLAQGKKVFSEYERITSDGECCALATRMVVYPYEMEKLDAADPMLDSVVGTIGNVFDVLVAEFAYHRTVADYRAETYASFVALAEEKAELNGQIETLKTRREENNGRITEIFRSELAL